MATPPVAPSQEDLGAQYKYNRYPELNVNWNNSKNYWNKESTAQSAAGYYAQTIMHKIAAVVVGFFESIQNLFLWIGNQFIGLANTANRCFNKEQVAQENAQVKEVPNKGEVLNEEVLNKGEVPNEGEKVLEKGLQDPTVPNEDEVLNEEVPEKGLQDPTKVNLEKNTFGKMVLSPIQTVYKLSQTVLNSFFRSKTEEAPN